MSKEIIEFGDDLVNLIGAFFPPVAAGKSIYDFVKEQNAKRYARKLYWFAKSAKNGNIDENEFSKFFIDNEHFYVELFDVLSKLDTEEAVSDFVKIFNELRKGTISAELFGFFVYVITRWLLADRGIMIAVWKEKGSPIVTTDMKKVELLSVDNLAGHEIIEPLKRLVAYGLVNENVEIKIDHEYNKRLSFGNEINTKHTYIYEKKAMILCSILG